MKQQANANSFRLEQLLFPLAALFTLAMAHSPLLSILADFSLLLFAAMVVLLGVPHGALDTWVAQQHGLCRTWFQTAIFNLAYLGIAGAVVFAWVLAPGFCLGFFLLISGLHFSGDWKGQTTWQLHLPAGALLLLMPIGFYPEQVATAFQHLSGEQGLQLARFLALPTWLLNFSMAMLIAAVCFHKKWQFAAECFLLWMLALTLQPLFYFAIYFCLLHSPRHLLGLFQRADTQHHPRMLTMTVIYTLATICMAGMLAFLWREVPAESLTVRLVFIGLAALTVPHMLLLGWVYLQRRTV